MQRLSGRHRRRLVGQAVRRIGPRHPVGQIGRGVRQARRWNTYEIVAIGSHVRTWINGQLCVDLDDPLGARRGITAVQLHSGGKTEVRFRNFKLELDPKESRSVIDRRRRSLGAVTCANARTAVATIPRPTARTAMMGDRPRPTRLACGTTAVSMSIRPGGMAIASAAVIRRRRLA